MKPNKLFGLCAAAVLMSALAACGQQNSQAEYIGIDAAKAIALENAGVSETAASFSTAGLDRQNGIDFYAVDFSAGGQSYEYDIDAITGVIISSTPADSTQSTAPSAVPSPADPSPSVSIPAGSPAPSAPSQSGQVQTGTAITEDRAKELALAAAGLSADQVTFLKCKLDYDDGRQVYDVEFYASDYTEYDYEIDAATGDVVSYDFDAEGYTPPTSGGTSITAEQAKEIALAEVPGATASDIYEFETDRDDGRLEYEGTIYYSGVEYEFTIDGYSGAIRSWEVDYPNR